MALGCCSVLVRLYPGCSSVLHLLSFRTPSMSPARLIVEHSVGKLKALRRSNRCLPALCFERSISSASGRLRMPGAGTLRTASRRCRQSGG